MGFDAGAAVVVVGSVRERELDSAEETVVDAKVTLVLGSGGGGGSPTS